MYRYQVTFTMQTGCPYTLDTLRAFIQRLLTAAHFSQRAIDSVRVATITPAAVLTNPLDGV